MFVSGRELVSAPYHMSLLIGADSGCNTGQLHVGVNLVASLGFNGRFKLRVGSSLS